jgi:asparagine synthase (glutamine-hydrolysing)
MSAQFGRWNFDGEPIDPDCLNKAMATLLPYGPDRGEVYSIGSLGILYRAFHTTKESRQENQPLVSGSGVIVVWDGRLDNRDQLLCDLDLRQRAEFSDAAIVMAAYLRWGTQSFAKLIGDWALTIVDPSDRSVIFAKDPFGARHLYYVLEHQGITWSTVLDPLVLLAERSFAMSEEYIAGWLSYFPEPSLTPYKDVQAVPPCSCIRIRPGQCRISQYWAFDPGKKVRYRSDLEYEEHFRALFKQSVRRRLRSDTPIIAELSGGMDSSSIVCTADVLIGEGTAEAPRLDTLSYYDDSEPNWDERPYFQEIEKKRGQIGVHIDLSSQEMFNIELEPESFVATPGARLYRSSVDKQATAHMLSRGNRVVLSGIGGDELLGGVPTPIPELADLVATARVPTLARQMKIWSLQSRRSWLRLLVETLREFLPRAVVPLPDDRQPARWLQSSFVDRQRLALNRYGPRLRLFGPLPSFQEALNTFEGLQRQLECFAVPPDLPYEKRYPYLDRDLAEFLYAVPRDQLVRPGQRRSLMRRALAGVVPDAILNRRRKAFVARAPIVAISREWTLLTQVSSRMVSDELGIVDGKNFHEALGNARRGQEIPIGAVIRTLDLEFWLRDLQRCSLSGKAAVEFRGSTREAQEIAHHGKVSCM